MSVVARGRRVAHARERVMNVVRLNRDRWADVRGKNNTLRVVIADGNAASVILQHNTRKCVGLACMVGEIAEHNSTGALLDVDASNNV